MVRLQGEPRRAHSIKELDTIMDAFFDEDAYEHGLAFKPQSSDIFISPYAKSGTTMLQQIAHQLRTRGNMDFIEISHAAPWINVAADLGIDLEAPQAAEPRVFKTHLSWHDSPKGGRHIVSFRDYHTAMVSFYRFFEGWYFEPGTITMEELIGWRWPKDEMGEHGYWVHLSSWWEQRDNPDVLLLCYEDIVADKPTAIRQIAEFMDIELDNELFETVMHYSSREFMLAHSDQFDDHILAEIGGKRANLPPALDSRKVTEGAQNKERYKLSAEIVAYLDSIWDEQMVGKYGLGSYSDLREAVRGLR